MKKSLLVYCKDHDPIFAIHIVCIQREAELIASADRIPSTVIGIICFPDQPVAQIRILHLGLQYDLIAVLHGTVIFQFNVRTAVEFNLFVII